MSGMTKMYDKNCHLVIDKLCYLSLFHTD